VLYLVCDHIYNKVTECLEEISTKNGTLEELEEAIRQYFLLIDRMIDEFTVMYQETKSLPKEAMQYVLGKELEMVSLFEKILQSCVKSGEIELTDQEIYLAANHLVIQGQSWAFRKWAYHKEYTIEEFIAMQTRLFLKGILHFRD